MSELLLRRRRSEWVIHGMMTIMIQRFVIGSRREAGLQGHTVGERALDAFGLQQGSVVGFSECRNVPSVSVKCGEFFEWLSDY
jgi:hypothetical protein